MTDLDALLAAVIDCPEDDTPRLVLADWLDDHGGTVPCPACALDKPPGIPGGLAYVRMGPDSRWASCTRCSGSGVVSDGMRERAEFIRVQVELARMADPECLHCWPGNGCRYHELRRRERELLDAHGAEWLRGLPNGESLVEIGCA